ncbi:unnamed protein product [Mytilus coruscus]|uniref:SWIM-type domain-containing protein n=1 Tax=Mytilus coruscus TaxID=42192 RepID=A0A6J8D022_MYTCO|nr:unnamed protein product [Mytilus coruscus]
MVKEYKCSLCGKCHLKDRRPIKSTPLKKYVSSIIRRNIENDEVICGNRTEIVVLLENVWLTMSKSSILDFDNPSRLTDDDYYNLTGLTKQQFEDLSTYSTTIRQSNDDVCIVDRGFRDVVEHLEEQGYSVQMPLYLKKGQKQHTTEEANTSRLVTKVRWIVESVNGRLKQWRFFDKVVSNHYIPFIRELLRLIKANLIKIKLQSRFSNSATHTVFVQFTLDGEISGWYCTCKVGARIVGCCAHVSSVLWYLGLHRLQNTSINSPRFTKSVLDASDLPDLETDSDCSSDVEELFYNASCCRWAAVVISLYFDMI